MNPRILMMLLVVMGVIGKVAMGQHTIFFTLLMNQPFFIWELKVGERFMSKFQLSKQYG